MGVDIPRSVVFGKNVKFPHNAIGTVIHDKTIIEDNVKIYQNVTIGRADIFKTFEIKKDFKGAYIEHDACICADAKILFKDEIRIGAGAVVGANAVLLNSIGPGEIWAGVPAKLIGYRKE